MPINLNRAELLCQLALLRAPRVGSVAFRKLLDHFGSAATLFAANPCDWRSAGLSERTAAYLAQPAWHAAEADLAWQQARPHRAILGWSEPAYPARLKAVDGGPPLLFVEGDVSILDRAQLAIVGSRTPTPLGTETTRHMAAALTQAGLTITSGLALGVDAAAHRGALGGGGTTVAVLGNGLDRIYPPQHHDLAAEISQRGALVSEFPTGTPLAASNFPRRNRIISGISLGVLVTEATVRSGSLITARYALEQGREVFAMPGSIHNPLAKGCHALIRDGAKLVETAEHVLEELRTFALPAASYAAYSADLAGDELTPEETILLQSIAYDPVSIDTLVDSTGASAEVLAAALMMLELKGYIAALPGGAYQRQR